MLYTRTRVRLSVLLLALSAESVPALAQSPPSPDAPAVSINGDLSTGRIAAAKHTTGSLADAVVNVSLTTLGAGVDGPLTAQTGAFISATKDNWFPGTGAAAGEVDVLSLIGRQGGPANTSDMSGMLINVQAADGTKLSGIGSFLAATEMLTSLVDPTTAVITKAIDIQDGILNTHDGSYIGRQYAANTGALGTAIQVSNNPGASWSDFFIGQKDGAITLRLSANGNVNTQGSMTAPGFSTGGDPANGDIVLGGATGTPYVSFQGISNTSLFGDAPDRLSVRDNALGTVAVFQAASSANGGNVVTVNGQTNTLGTATTADLVVAGTGSIAGAWTSVALSAATSSGTLGAATATLRYKKFGRIIFYNVVATITDVGSGSGSLSLSGFPFASPSYCILAGREQVVTGKMLDVNISPNTLAANIWYFDNSAPVAAGVVIAAGGSCETTN